MTDSVETPEYVEFREKFVPKKTTDDCYTPPEVYECIRDWAVREFGLQGREVVRPFWPGADYTRAEYPEGCVVIDNPPFSIGRRIASWYMEREVGFVLFAPSLTVFDMLAVEGVHIIPIGCNITYANGAVINTSLMTSFGDADVMIRPDLADSLKNLTPKKRAAVARRVEYDPHILHYRTASKIRERMDISGTYIGCRLANGYHPFGGGGVLVNDETVRTIQESFERNEKREVLYVGLTEEELAVANDPRGYGHVLHELIAERKVRKLDEWTEEGGE